MKEELDARTALKEEECGGGGGCVGRKEGLDWNNDLLISG